jgi:hypothetical protein
MWKGEVLIQFKIKSQDLRGETEENYEKYQSG